ncbi:MAG TPA: hypothetical protein VNY27_12580 [Solirubrobacteraceae bacterium]|jgi:hypothetical protein|nr:hypothetical protein [Solirubrobacteraceae bacterium]
MSSETPPPPAVGEPLPRAAEALGIRDKLETYSLDVNHKSGGPKARGFERILGITIMHIDYLEGTILTGILTVPVSSVRDKPPWGVECVVVVPVRGRGEKSGRVVDVRTAWLLPDAGGPPQMTTAFPRP